MCDTGRRATRRRRSPHRASFRRHRADEDMSAAMRTQTCALTVAARRTHRLTSRRPNHHKLFDAGKSSIRTRRSQSRLRPAAVVTPPSAPSPGPTRTDAECRAECRLEINSALAVNKRCGHFPVIEMSEDMMEGVPEDRAVMAQVQAQVLADAFSHIRMALHAVDSQDRRRPPPPSSRCRTSRCRPSSTRTPLCARR